MCDALHIFTGLHLSGSSSPAAHRYMSYSGPGPQVCQSDGLVSGA